MVGLLEGEGEGEPTSLSLESPGTLDEGETFNLHALLSPPGVYEIWGIVDWGDSPGMGADTFQTWTMSDGSF